MNYKTRDKDLKNEIIEVSTRLFFEKGYTNTSLSDIANELGIGKGHISYYFSTKAEIGSIIYNNYTRLIKKVVQEKMTSKYGGYDNATATAVEFRLTNLMYKTYPTTVKFYEDLVGSLFTNVSQNGPERIIEVANQLDLPWGNDVGALEFTSYSWNGAIASVIIQYFNGNIKQTYEAFDDSRVALPFRLANVNEKRVNKIVKESKIVFNELNFEVLPYFKVK